MMFFPSIAVARISPLLDSESLMILAIRLAVPQLEEYSSRISVNRPPASMTSRREIGFHDRPAGGGANDADRWRAGVFDRDRTLGQRQQWSAGKRTLHRRHKQPSAVEAGGGADAGNVHIQMIAIARAGAGTVAVTITTATLAALLSC